MESGQLRDYRQPHFPGTTRLDSGSDVPEQEPGSLLVCPLFTVDAQMAKLEAGSQTCSPDKAVTSHIFGRNADLDLGLRTLATVRPHCRVTKNLSNQPITCRTRASRAVLSSILLEPQPPSVVNAAKCVAGGIVIWSP